MEPAETIIVAIIACILGLSFGAGIAIEADKSEKIRAMRCVEKFQNIESCFEILDLKAELER